MLSLAPEQRLLDRFVLLEKIGTGGHGEVWRAQDTQSDSPVAIKVLFPQLAHSGAAWELLQHEYDIAQRLSHKSILEVYQPLRDEQFTVLPMQLATGDLRRLRGDSYLRIVPMLLDIADALAHAHARGVIHRDLKPANVLVCDEGQIKLADFGAARLSEGDESANAGSPFSASPQQLLGEPASPLDDVYGLGALAYELLSGYPPHYPNFDRKVMVEQPVPPLQAAQALPPRLDALVMRMLAKSPEGRPASMEEVLEGLRAALQDTLENVADSGEHPVAEKSIALDDTTNETLVLEGGSDTGSNPVLEDQPPRRKLWLWASAGAAVVLLAAVFLLLPRFAKAPPASAAAGKAAGPAVDATEAAAQLEARRAAREQTFAGRRKAFDQLLAQLETQQAAVWAGPAFAAGKSLGLDAAAAQEAAKDDIANDRLDVALKRLQKVADLAPQAYKAQMTAGEQALQDGQIESARAAFELALKLKPADRDARLGLERSTQLLPLLPVLVQADNDLAQNKFRAATEGYATVLRVEPRLKRAIDGLARARGSLGTSEFQGALGSGLAALRAGKLDEARSALERARALNPDAPEVAAAFSQLEGRKTGISLATDQQGILQLETSERWADALSAYNAVLKNDASVEFARAGKARVTPRVELARRLQGLIDQPDRLASPAVRTETEALLTSARATTPTGPVLRSQILRLELLVPQYEKPVRVMLESDNQTTLTLSGVGALGSFAQLELELLPGKYTLTGTRDGYRDVRRELAVKPGDGKPVFELHCTDTI